jgi:hypothetical protein
MLQLEAEIEILRPLLYCTEFCSDCLPLHVKQKSCSEKRGIWAHYGRKTLRGRQYLIDLNVVGMKLR